MILTNLRFVPRTRNSITPTENSISKCPSFQQAGRQSNILVVRLAGGCRNGSMVSFLLRHQILSLPFRLQSKEMDDHCPPMCSSQRKLRYAFCGFTVSQKCNRSLPILYFAACKQCKKVKNDMTLGTVVQYNTCCRSSTKKDTYKRSLKDTERKIQKI